MDMMAMAFLFDMASKQASRNRRADDLFVPPRPSRTKSVAKWLVAALFLKRRPAGTCDHPSAGSWTACRTGIK